MKQIVCLSHAHWSSCPTRTQQLMSRLPGTEILFVGADGGMETRLVPREGYPIKTVTISSFYRSLSVSSLKHNVKTVMNLGKSKKQARAILDGFKPDLVVGTGV